MPRRALWLPAAAFGKVAAWTWRGFLEALTHADGLPREALRAAGKRRRELIGPFLAAIDEAVAARPDEREVPSPLFFAIFLLAEWRETAAFRPLLRLLRLPSERLEAVLGDALVEDGHRVVAAVFDGDAAPLLDAIRGPDADEFSRASLFEALAMLVEEGRVARAEAVAFLRDGFATLEPRTGNFVWMGWLDRLGGVRARPRRSGAASGRPLEVMGRHDRRAVGLARLHRGGAPGRGARTTDRGAADRGSPAARQPVPRRGPQPCPCGSGRKFKRCCAA